MHTTMQLARFALLVLILFLVMATSTISPITAAPNIPGDEKWVAGPTLGGVNGDVRAMAVDGAGNVYVGGYFTAVGNLPIRNIAKWNGSVWSPVGNGLPGGVHALVWDSVHQWLYVGGYFTEICSNADCTTRIPANHVARWDPAGGGTWSSLQFGVFGNVDALAIDSIGQLYAGGYFGKICSDPSCSVPGTVANNIAMWNPAGAGSWSTLASGGVTGVMGSVHALAWWNKPGGGVVVVGGSITKAGNIKVNRIAMWDPAGAGAWNPFWNGVDAAVTALAVDLTTKSIIVGGDFTNICQMGAVPPACGTPTRVNHVAISIGGTPWVGLGNGVATPLEGSVEALAIESTNKNVYVGGHLTGYCTDLACTGQIPADHIARYDYSGGGAWSALGSGINGYVGALAWNGTTNVLYAGGSFTKAGDTTTAGLATWSGSAWSGFGFGNGAARWVYAVASDRDGRVYVGGSFSRAGNVTVNNLALWDSTTGTWSALGNGLAGVVYAMVLDSDGTLYVGGLISDICADSACTAGGTWVNNIVKWTPSGASGAWSSVGFGLNGVVSSLALDRNGNLYAGAWYGQKICGDANCVNTTPVGNITRWNGQAWSGLGDSLKGGVYGLALDQNDNLYAGGDFRFVCVDLACTLSGTQVNYLVRRPAGSGSWQSMGSGVDGVINSITLDRSNNVYAGGKFKYLCAAAACAANTVNANHVAKWNGSSWSVLDNGLQDEVTAMTVDDRNNLYSVGYFQNLCGNSACTSAGAVVNHIARWDGMAWSGLGSGLGPSVASDANAISYRGAFLTVGGYFATAGDKVSANVARYNAGAFLFLPLVKR